MKTCSKCGTEKSRDEFYSRGSECRVCHRARCRRWYRANRDRHIANVAAYEKTEAGKATKERKDTIWRNKNPLKILAHKLVRKAVQKGELVRPEHCEDCNKSCKLHGHHEDYTQPLVVNWLCPACHALRHRDDLLDA